MTPADVRVDDVALWLGARPAIDGVTMRASGGIVVVLGANGAGKTTLLRCLATVLVPDRGSVSIDGLDPALESERIEIRRRLGYLDHTGDGKSGTPPSFAHRHTRPGSKRQDP